MNLRRLRPDVVDKAVPHGLIGTYLLGTKTKNGTFVPQYVGRSDVDLRRRLLQHAEAGGFEWFALMPAETIFEAYQVECRGWHLFTRLANAIHPGAPRNLPYKCPYCIARMEFAEYLRRVNQ